MFGLSLSPVVLKEGSCYLCLLAHSGVQQILYCVFVLSMLPFSLDCPYFIAPLHTLYCVFVLSMLPFSLDCPYFIAPLVFSNIYLQANRNAIAYIKMPPIREVGRVI